MSSHHDCDDDPDCQYCHHVCALKPPAVPEASTKTLPVGRGDLYAGRARANARAAEEEIPEAATKTLPEGWTFDGDETAPGYINADGDSAEIFSDNITVGVHHSGHKTHYFTEIPLPVLRALLATQGLSIIGAKDRAVLGTLANLDQGALEWIKAELDRRKP